MLRDGYAPAEFHALITRETNAVELKRGASRKSLQEALVAFSNTEGGVIFLGVTDERVVVGCPLTQRVDDTIHDAINDANDVGSVIIREQLVAMTPVVAIEVKPRTDGFAQTSDGRVLTRKGARNRALVGAELSRFLDDRRLRAFESTESEVTLEQCDPSALEDLRLAYGWQPDSDLEARLRERQLLGPGRQLTIAGALVLADPLSAMPSAKFVIDVRGYDDDTTTRYVRRDEISGPLPRQVRDAALLVARDVGTDFFVLGLHRRDIPRLPADVVREAIANAVGHRSYEERGAAVVVEVRPGRVVVRSPGGFPSGVRAADLRNAQKARNPVVLDVLRRYALAEDSGRGIDLIEDEMSAAFLLPPTFAEEGGNVVVTLPSRGFITAVERAWVDELQDQGKLGPPERLLLVQAARGARLTNWLARSLTGQDSAEARRSLALLRDGGLLLQHGTRGGSSYTLGDLASTRGEHRVDQIVLARALSAPVTNTVVRELTGLDREAARRLLKDLVDRGDLRQHGSRRGTFYTHVE